MKFACHNFLAHGSSLCQATCNSNTMGGIDLFSLQNSVPISPTLDTLMLFVGSRMCESLEIGINYTNIHIAAFISMSTPKPVHNNVLAGSILDISCKKEIDSGLYDRI